MNVLSPCPGTVVAMADVPDPVFAEDHEGVREHLEDLPRDR